MAKELGGNHGNPEKAQPEQPERAPQSDAPRRLHQIHEQQRRARQSEPLFPPQTEKPTENTSDLDKQLEQLRQLRDAAAKRETRKLRSAERRAIAERKTVQSGAQKDIKKIRQFADKKRAAVERRKAEQKAETEKLRKQAERSKKVLINLERKRAHQKAEGGKKPEVTVFSRRQTSERSTQRRPVQPGRPTQEARRPETFRRTQPETLRRRRRGIGIASGKEPRSLLETVDTRARLLLRRYQKKNDVQGLALTKRERRYIRIKPQRVWGEKTGEQVVIVDAFAPRHVKIVAEQAAAVVGNRNRSRGHI